jgi:hypothetical protein
MAGALCIQDRGPRRGGYECGYECDTVKAAPPRWSALPGWLDRFSYNDVKPCQKDSLPAVSERQYRLGQLAWRFGATWAANPPRVRDGQNLPVVINMVGSRNEPEWGVPRPPPALHQPEDGLLVGPAAASEPASRLPSGTGSTASSWTGRGREPRERCHRPVTRPYHGPRRNGEERASSSERPPVRRRRHAAASGAQLRRCRMSGPGRAAGCRAVAQ